MNKAKRKGTSGENEARDWWQPWYPATERLALAGTLDRGDLTGLPFVVSVKRCESWAVHKWLNELRKMRINAGGLKGVIQARRSRESWVFLVPEDVMAHLIDNYRPQP